MGQLGPHCYGVMSLSAIQSMPTPVDFMLRPLCLSHTVIELTRGGKVIFPATLPGAEPSVETSNRLGEMVFDVETRSPVRS